MFFRRSTRRVLLVLLAAILLLSACNVGGATPAATQDINALNTAIVGTTVAQLSGQFTQTALAAPTNTPPPTNTQAAVPAITLPTLAGGTSSVASPTLNAAALPTFSFASTAVPTTGASGATQAPVTVPTTKPAGQATAALNDACDSLAFEGDATIPDGTVLEPGVNFKKEWSVRNTGNCTWHDGYVLVYIGGSTPDLDPVNYVFGKNNNDSDFVAPGQGVNLGVNLTTPCTPGKYTGTWRMRNSNGYYFGTYLSVSVEVTDTKKC
jgi:Ig-like domain-containing protein